MRCLSFFKCAVFFIVLPAAVVLMINDADQPAHADGPIAASMAEKLGGQAKDEQSFSPVRLSERKMMLAVNEKRTIHHRRLLKPDWDLSRLARFQAEDLAAGKQEQVDKALVEQSLSNLAVSYKRLFVLTGTGKLGPAGMLARWERTKEGKNILENAGLSRQGIGHVQTAKKDYWVALFLQR